MQEGIFTLSKPEDFVPSDHPLRSIAVLVNAALNGMNGQFSSIYAETGRASHSGRGCHRGLEPGRLGLCILAPALKDSRSSELRCNQIQRRTLRRSICPTALSLHAYAYRANVFLHRRPGGCGCVGATAI